MKPPQKELDQNDETLEHLLGVVAENREKRCAELREKARLQARIIVDKAYTRSRGRLHRHVIALREKYRLRMAAAQARIGTMKRRQQQQEDRAVLDTAWPTLRDAMLDLWKDPLSRRHWLFASTAIASSRLSRHDWHVEHPPDLDARELNTLDQQLREGNDIPLKLAANSDIEAGIRIIAEGAVIDTTIEGLLHREQAIEAALIAHLRKSASSDE